MAHYNIFYLSRQTVWFNAILSGLDQLARSNPGWTYCIEKNIQQSELVPHLYILDLTAAEEAFVESFPVSSPRLLVLVHASQRRIIRQLFEGSRCSILCVDEYHFVFRNIIETSVRNKRFLSPFIHELTAQTRPAEEQVILTDAECKVLEFIREGLSGIEISQALFRSQKTISSHKRNIMRKLGVQNDLGLKKKLMAMAESL